MKKQILTPERAQEIQNQIYYNLPAEKKIRLTSQLFLLSKKLKESKTITNEPRRTARKSS